MGKTMNAGVMEMVAWGYCMMAIMFAAQLCMSEPTSTSAPVIMVNQSTSSSLNTETIRFSSDKVTIESYSRFLLRLLHTLTENADTSGSIPILPQLLPNDSSSYIHVEISNGGSETITFAIEISNVYVVGYQNHANSVAYLFKSYGDGDMQKAAFPDAISRQRLSFNGNYDSLGDRSTVPLGFIELSNAISALYYSPPSGRDDTPLRRAFLVVIQMISEAARLKNLRNRILDTITRQPYTSDGLMQEYENEWSSISCQVQRANPNGDFQTPITLTYDSQQLVLQSVSQVRPIIGLLLRGCRSSELQAQGDVVLSTNPKSTVVA